MGRRLMSDTTSQTATRPAEARYTVPPTSTHVVDIAAAMREFLETNATRRQTRESTDSR